MYRRSSESRMRSGTCRGVSKWSRRKDRYIGRFIRSSERFRVIRVFFVVPENYWNSPGSIWALLGHTGIEERGQKEGGLRPLVRIGQGAQPPFPSSSPPLSPSPTPTRKEGVLLPVGVGLPLARPLLGRPPPPPLLLYIRGQGGTSRHTTLSS